MLVEDQLVLYAHGQRVQPSCIMGHQLRQDRFDRRTTINTLHPNKLNFIILPSLMPNNFIYQGESTGAQWRLSRVQYAPTELPPYIEHYVCSTHPPPWSHQLSLFCSVVRCGYRHDSKTTQRTSTSDCGTKGQRQVNIASYLSHSWDIYIHIDLSIITNYTHMHISI